MTEPLRIIDTGVRGARDNLAITAALAELHRQRAVGDTLRFQHFTPAAIIGRHQVLSAEVNVDYCRAAGIEMARRQTGGGAIYMGPGMLGFELIAHRAGVGPDLDSITARLCTALAEALASFGIDARYRPRNDVEVGGAKLSGTGGFVDGGTLVFQGTVLAGFDIADMAAALVLPRAKLDRKGLDALAARVTSLQRLIGQPPPMRLIEDRIAASFAALMQRRPEWQAGLSPAEHQAAAAAYTSEIGQDEFVHGDHPGKAHAQVSSAIDTPGGRIEAAAKLTGNGRIERLWITGDIFLTPPRALPDLEAALAGVPLAEAVTAAEAFLDRHPVDMLGATSRDLTALMAALAAGITATTRTPA